MNSETTFTASSGHQCNYEVIVDNSAADVNVLWIGQQPTPEDFRELEQFLIQQADQAGFPHTGAEHHVLGQIQSEDLPRVNEIFDERKRELEDGPDA